MEDIEDLVKKLHQIYNKINFRLNNETISFEYNDYYSELQQLHSYSALRNFIYQNRKKHVEVVLLTDLLNII